MVVCEFGLPIPYLPWEVFSRHSGFLLRLKNLNPFIFLVNSSPLSSWVKRMLGCLGFSYLCVHCAVTQRRLENPVGWKLRVTKLQIIVIVIIVLHQIWPIILPQCTRFVQKHVLFLENQCFQTQTQCVLCILLQKNKKTKTKKNPPCIIFLKVHSCVHQFMWVPPW